MAGRRGVALALVALSICACGGVQRLGAGIARAAPAGPVVPWVATPGAATPKPVTVAGIAPCEAAELDFSVHGQDPGAGPANTSWWIVGVKPKVGAACFVGSTLDVRIQTARGTLALPAGRTVGDVIYLSPAVREPFIASAQGEIDFFSCVYPPVSHMELSPGPTLGWAAVEPGAAGGWGTPCASPPHGDYLAELRGRDCCSGFVARTQTQISAPLTVHPGAHVRFLVTLVNAMAEHSSGAGSSEPTPPPWTFTPCPSYHEEIEGVTGSLRDYRLNCGAARPIQANQSERFEMFIDVPAAANPGPAVLSWALDGSAEQYQTVTTNLEIAP